MNQETPVQETPIQRAFQATAALFRALGVSQQTASRELGLRGHTSFSFWKGGQQEFQGKYAVALYRIVVEGVNTHWPKRIDDQKFVTDKLLDVFAAWEAACQQWGREANDALQMLQQVAKRTQQFGDPHAPSYAHELQRIGREIGQLSESLQRIGEFEEAWQRGRIQILKALEDAKQHHEAAKAAQPPMQRTRRPRRKAQRRTRTGARS